MDDDSHSESEFQKLRKEIEMLKRNQGDSDTSDEDLKSGMINLSRSMTSLIKIFKDASQDLKMDTHDAVLVSQKLDKIIERLDKIEVQNEKIAKGIVAIADMLEDIQIRPRQEPPVKSSLPPSSFSQQDNSKFESKPLPSYNIPRQSEERKKSFLNFKI